MFALSLLVGLPVAGMLVWKVVLGTMKKRAGEAMSRGNRIYNDWLHGRPNNEIK